MKNIKVEIGYAITNRRKDREKEMTEDCEVNRMDKILSKKIAAFI